MKKALIIGAAICGLIGSFLILSFIVGLYEIWPGAFTHGWGDLIAYSFLSTIVLLAFAPMLILIRYKRSTIGRLRLVFIGVIELIVVGLFILMLFPRL